MDMHRASASGRNSEGLRRGLAALALGIALGGCSALPDRADPVPLAQSLSSHRDGDDLLTAGLGWEGLAAPLPPVFDASPRALRQRAVWHNWRGIAQISTSGLGSGRLEQAPVPGRELHALLALPSGQQRHRVLLQLPDRFDPKQPCLVVSASSGSRGIYGAIALAGGWGLPRGCAVAYTDKGGGSDWIAPGSTRGPGLHGVLPAPVGAPLRFTLAAPAQHVAVPHLHSGDQPEALWGAFVRQTGAWARAQIRALVPEVAGRSEADWRVIATGLSNGGGAVLQAAALEWPVDAVVAISPNVLPSIGGRALFDYASEAALWLPCAAGHQALRGALLALEPSVTEQRCASLRHAGVMPADGDAASAYRYLREQGWSAAALEAAVASARLDLWRAVAAGYASAYLRRGPDAMPCGYRYVLAEGADPARWWSDSSGIPPGVGVQLLAPASSADDPELAGLLCLRQLWEGDDAEARALRAEVERTRSGQLRTGLKVWVLHGEEDGLVPIGFSSDAYRAAHAGWPELRYRALPRAQHFDSLLGLQAAAERYRALLPEAYAALDAAWDALSGEP
jgi:hydroxybutyrate-dimer hydrolase